MMKLLSLLLCLILLFCCLPAFAESTESTEKTVVVLDTDPGTDDAMALLVAGALNIHFDYVVATPGNASPEGVVRNANLLQKVFGFSGTIVRGYEKPATGEQSTFHGLDGLGNQSESMIAAYQLNADDLNTAMPFEDFVNELRSCDRIYYISVGPLSTLSYLCNLPEINEKLDTLYIMGGGFDTFNSDHQTEFNFFNDPKSACNVLSSGHTTYLFPLDLTHQQTLVTEQIDELQTLCTLPGCIELLRFNLKANDEADKLPYAIMHDMMPVLYCFNADLFDTEDVLVTIDEYGHIEKADEGYPVTVATNARVENLAFNMLKEAFALQAEASAQSSTTELFIPASEETVAYLATVDRTPALAQWDDLESSKERLAGRIGHGMDMSETPELANRSEMTESNGIPVLTIQKDEDYDKILFYLHGGAYVYEAYDWQIAHVDRIVSATGVKAYLPYYKLAPDYTWKDSFDTLYAIYQELLAQGKEIYIAGDSAGGGLTLAFVHYLNMKNAPLPTKMVLHSPWVDVTMSDEGIDEFKATEIMLPKTFLILCGEAWAGELDTKDPLISPLYGNFDHMPETLLFTSTNEIFYPQISALRRNMEKANVNLTFVTIAEGYHVISVQGGVPEGAQAEQISADFLNR